MVTILSGLPDGTEKRAAALYWEAFNGKLETVLGPSRKGLQFIERVIDKSHAVSAVNAEGALLGVAGFQTAKGGLVDGDFADLRAIYGLFGALWRAAFLQILKREVENVRFLMDGIFVTAEARGQGVGTALLSEIEREAIARGHSAVRLDVIAQNTRARALYERSGYRAIKTTQMGPLELLFKFKSSTSMVKDLTVRRD